MDGSQFLALLTDEDRERVATGERRLLDRAVVDAADLMDSTPGDLVLDGLVQQEARARLSVNAVGEQHRAWLEASSDRWITRQRRRARNRITAVPLLVCVLTWLAAVVYAVAAAKGRDYLPAYDRSNLSFSLGALLLAVSVSLALWTWRRPTRIASARTKLHLTGTEDRLFLALRSEAESLLSTVLNERWEQSKGELAALDSRGAPNLVELESVNAVPSKSVREIYDFIEEHRASAIGISGTRGVGKTTLMQSVQNWNPENYIGVYVPVPVHYAAPDFFRMLFREVADAILKSNREGIAYLEQQNRVIRHPTDLVRLAVGPVFVLVGVILISYGRTTASSPVKLTDIPGLLLVFAGLGIAVVAALSSPAVRRAIREFMGPRYVERDISLAADALRALDYSATHQRLSKNAFAFKLFTMEDHEQLDLAERELTHPELVLKFKNFVSSFIRTSPRQIIVALDELDKMEDGEDAVAFVNSIKDLLHIQGVHFLVSVSEDALHNFSLRGVPVRDVFDSSFDSIIPVQRFTAEESKNLLKSRVVGFPDPIALFCHAMSGGVPRDLIRVARECVRVAKESGSSVPVDRVVRSEVGRQARLVCEALAARMRQEQKPVTTAFFEALPAMRAAGDTTTLVAAVEEVVQRIRIHLVGEYSPAEDAAVYLSCLATICGYFGVPRTNASWQRERDAGTSVRVAETVAEALELLRVDAGITMAALASVRADVANIVPTT
ncbi:P-loop NTPase fold protein [Streptomyces sp. NPDC048489]|uniref:P-loop NTPase fold protein n=1 Tax=Streptomyces sp. NPDC048489 TaxID=3154504 RepID=UPI00341BF33A